MMDLVDAVLKRAEDKFDRGVFTLTTEQAAALRRVVEHNDGLAHPFCGKRLGKKRTVALLRQLGWEGETAGDLDTVAAAELGRYDFAWPTVDHWLHCRSKRGALMFGGDE